MCGRGMWSRLSEYEGPADRESAQLTLSYAEGRIPFGTYARRQRALRHSATGSLAFVLFMATILPVVDWMQSAARRFRCAVRGCYR